MATQAELERLPERLMKRLLFGREHSVFRMYAALFGLMLGLFGAEPAFAHPHVFVRIKVEVRYGADGLPGAIHQTWIFDEMFSAFQTYGLGTGNAPPTREQLAPVAAKFMDSMKLDDYFTRVNVNNKDVRLGAPKDAFLEFTDGVLRLQFELPFPQAEPGDLSVTIYDPVYYVALTLSGEDATRLTGAPASCSIAASNAQEPKAVDESFFQSLKPDQDWARQFASTLNVVCR